MLKRIVKNTANKLGYSVTRLSEAEKPQNEFPLDFEDQYIEIIKKCKPYTMTSNERLYQLILCVKYVIENNIHGDFVECGVWRGGSILAIIETLKSLNVKNRKIHLFDTFSSEDIFNNDLAVEEDKPFDSTVDELKADLADKNIDFSVNLDDVKELMKQTGYPTENVVFHVGRVEQTIPPSRIESISLLRLDTDWYDSTKIQLENFYQKVNRNGVVIFDDYGFWEGHKKAVDEYLSRLNSKPLLIRNDWSCRFLIKNVD